MNRLILFRGWPGSGKTQAAYHMFPGTFHIENDMFHIHNGKYEWKLENMPKAISWCIETCKSTLALGFDAVVCNTFTKRKFVEAYKKIAEEFGAKFEVYRCIGNFNNIHGLSDKIVQNFKNAMEDWPGEVIVDLKMS
jgi:hypothetical protein